MSEVKTPAPGMTGKDRPYDTLLERIDALTDEVARLSAREAELRLIAEKDTEYEVLFNRLEKTIDKSTNDERVTAAIDAAELHLDPFPYAVIDNLFPNKLYQSLLRGIPPAQLFKAKAAGKEHLSVPFVLAPKFSQRVWGYLATELIPNTIAPRLIEKFRSPIDEWITRNWPELDPRAVALNGSDGRIMLRRRGYRIRPHRDPKWSFLTCILYLVHPGDSDAWGTQLYAVQDDEEAKSTSPHWIDESKCRLTDDVKFLPNRLLVFLNSVGAHGAFIPDDAEPADLERYIYQFRVGPNLDAITTLRAMLPENRQSLWAGRTTGEY